ncbi:MAG: hypothetical protein HYW56_00885 [Candidatus Harrisonbacteria bacterium]|nr:hypothetical protein [Candidatus Harrisonbacteria bacterium]
MDRTNRSDKGKGGNGKRRGEDVPRHVPHPELGNPQRVSPEERTLRKLLVTDIDNVSTLCAKNPDYNTVLERLAEEQSRIGERARVAQLFPAMEQELLGYLKIGSMDNAEALDALVARFMANDMEAVALHQALERCARSTLPVVREQAKQLRAALSIPNRMEEAKRLLMGDDGLAAIISTARFAGRDPMNFAAVEKIATMETGELQRRARVAQLYPSAMEHLSLQLDEARRDLGSALDLIRYIKAVGESPEGLALRVAFKVACKNLDNKYARYLRGIMNDELRHEFFSKFHASGVESVAEWMENLAAEQRKQLEFAMTVYMNDGAENVISTTAFKVYAAIHPPAKECPTTSIVVTAPPPPAKPKDDEWAQATVLNAY